MAISIRRLAPLVLATTVLALGATACSSDSDDSGGEQSSPSPSAETTAAESPSTEPTDTSETEAGGAKGACATGDLKFTVSEESQAGGYYLVTAAAEPGVTCTLEGSTIEAGFGSDVSGDVKPSEQAVGESITMTGSTKAYAGVNPNSGPQEGGVEFEEIIVSAREGDSDPVSLKLPSTAVVDEPVGTNWHTDATQAVPFTG